MWKTRGVQISSYIEHNHIGVSVSMIAEAPIVAPSTPVIVHPPHPIFGLEIALLVAPRAYASYVETSYSIVWFATISTLVHNTLNNEDKDPPSSYICSIWNNFRLHALVEMMIF